MVMNYDTYLEIDKDSDSEIPGKPRRIYKKRRHDEQNPSQKIRMTIDRAPKKLSSNMAGRLITALHNDEAITG